MKSHTTTHSRLKHRATTSLLYFKYPNQFLCFFHCSLYYYTKLNFYISSNSIYTACSKIKLREKVWFNTYTIHPKNPGNEMRRGLRNINNKKKVKNPKNKIFCSTALIRFFMLHNKNSNFYKETNNWIEF